MADPKKPVIEVTPVTPPGGPVVVNKVISTAPDSSNSISVGEIDPQFEELAKYDLMMAGGLSAIKHGGALNLNAPVQTAVVTPTPVTPVSVTPAAVTPVAATPVTAASGKPTAPQAAVLSMQEAGKYTFNADVARAQKLMNDLKKLSGDKGAGVNLGSYKDHPDGVDGKFGPKTRDSIIATEKLLGIDPPTGKITPGLVKKMEEKAAELAAKPTPAAAPVTAAPTTPAPTTVAAPVVAAPVVSAPAVAAPDRITLLTEHPPAQLAAIRADYAQSVDKFYATLSPEQKAMYTDPLDPFSGTDANGRPTQWEIEGRSAHRISGQHDANLDRFVATLTPEQKAEWDKLSHKAQVAGNHIGKPDDGIAAAPSVPYESPFDKPLKFNLRDRELIGAGPLNLKIGEPIVPPDLNFSDNQIYTLKGPANLLDLPAQTMNEQDGHNSYGINPGFAAGLGTKQGPLSTVDVPGYGPNAKPELFPSSRGFNEVINGTGPIPPNQGDGVTSDRTPEQVVEKLNGTDEGREALAALETKGLEGLDENQRKIILEAAGSSPAFKQFLDEQRESQLESFLLPTEILGFQEDKPGGIQSMLADLFQDPKINSMPIQGIDTPSANDGLYAGNDGLKLQTLKV